MPTVEKVDALRFLASIPDNTAHCVLIDPPYCSGALTEAGRQSSSHQGLRSDSVGDGKRFAWFKSDAMSTGGLCHLIREVALESERVLVDGHSFNCFCDWRMVQFLQPAIESAGFNYRSLVVWDKPNFGLGLGFRPKHEIILHFTKGKPEYYSKSVGNVIRCGRVHSKDRKHPTEKPIGLLQAILSVCSPRGGTVVDCFAGSGSTGIAAEELGMESLLADSGWEA